MNTTKERIAKAVSLYEINGDGDEWVIRGKKSGRSYGRFAFLADAQAHLDRLAKHSVARAQVRRILADAIDEGSMDELDTTGYCVHCGAEHYGVEPDARGYSCEVCGDESVYGAQELVMMLF